MIGVSVSRGFVVGKLRWSVGLIIGGVVGVLGDPCVALCDVLDVGDISKKILLFLIVD